MYLVKVELPNKLGLHGYPCVVLSQFPALQFINHSLPQQINLRPHRHGRCCAQSRLLLVLVHLLQLLLHQQQHLPLLLDLLLMLQKTKKEDK
jgi:hypothetical protein